MKLASYNVENLFQRARAMNMESWSDGADALKTHADLNRILGKKLIRKPTRKRTSRS